MQFLVGNYYSNDCHLHRKGKHLDSHRRSRALSSLIVLLNWQSWCHRRVDKYMPMDSYRGRVQHSLDCTLPTDLIDFCGPESVSGEGRCGTALQVIVPVAMAKKSTFLELDAKSADGTSLPVLTKTENEEISADVLEFLYFSILDKSNDMPNATKNVLRLALRKIVGDDPEAEAIAQELLTFGRFESMQLFDPKLIEGENAIQAFTKNLARGFLLCVVAPKNAVGQRVLIKVSYMWKFYSEPRRMKSRTVISGRRSLRLPMTGASDTGSYHIEIRLPESVICKGMRIPAPELGTGTENQRVHYQSDNCELRDTSAPTVHLSTSYAQPPETDPTAWLELGGAKTYLFWAAMIGGAFVSLMCWALWSFSEQLQSSSAYSGVIALFVTFPALILGLVSIREDHTLGREIAVGYRIALLSQGLVLFAAAGAPLVMKNIESLQVTWLVCAVVASLLWALIFLRQFWGPIRRASRTIYYGHNKPELSLEQEWRLGL